MFIQFPIPVRSIVLTVLVLLIHSTLAAQPTTRLGVYDGMGFTVINYNFLGSEHDRGFESMAVVGLMLEVPVARNFLLSFRPALTTLNGNAPLAARVQEASGTVTYRSSVEEQWIVEVPLVAKGVLNGRETRPYFCLGGFVDINSSPAEIRTSVDASRSMKESYSTVYGGVIAAVGVEINAASVLIFTPEFAVRQFLSRPIDTELLVQDNNPRFMLSVGLLFSLSHERW